MTAGNRHPQTPRPFDDMRETGLLWLINAEVFHPRGYALAFHIDDDGDTVGWSILGDGSEVWTFDLDRDAWPPGDHPDDALRRVKELLP